MTLHRVRMADLSAEALAGVLQRPFRSILTSLGTVVGVSTFIALSGITATAAHQVRGSFDAMAETQITLSDARQEDGAFDPGPVFPANAERTIKALPGVVDAGVSWTVDTHTGPSSSFGSAPVQVSVRAASPGLLDAAQVQLSSGRAFDEWADSRQASVVLLGAGAANLLGVRYVDGAAPPGIVLDGQVFAVMGVIRAAPRMPDLLLSVVVPSATAVRYWGQPGPRALASMLVVTDVGATSVVARHIAMRLRPDKGDVLSVVAPTDFTALREQVSAQLQIMATAIAALALLIGVAGILGATLVSVLERVPEIGLRRAIGARRRDIVGQFLLESSYLGVFGSIVGLTLGVLATVIVSVIRGWTPLLDPGAIVLAPLAGIAMGLFAGAYPARRASVVEPSVALRR